MARGSNLALIGDSLAKNLMVNLMQVNPTALRALDALRINQRAIGKATEVLATGQRVNSAADDAASLDVGRVMTSQYRGVLTAVRNIHDGLSLTQTAEAALTSIGNSMQRMRELAVQAASGTINDTQRGHLDTEYQEHKQHILSVVQNTRWNGYRLLRELSPSTFQVQAGADANQTIPITIPKVYADGTLVGFPNGDFESSTLGATSVSGWSISNTRVTLDGNSQIGGWPTPTDTTIPTNQNGSTGPGENTALAGSGSMTSVVVAPTGYAAGGGKALQMESSGMTVAQGYGIVHGPYVVSNTAVAIAAGESVSFDWKAQGGGDWYDVYAYLLNVDNGSTVELLNATGSSTNWTTATKTVPTAGNYKFVFVSGTYDASGGRALGARLFVDNIVAPPLASPTLNNTAITSTPAANEAMNQIDRDIAQVLSARASLGASLNRLTHAADNLMTNSTNLSASRSHALDADYAKSTEELARSQAIDSAAGLVLRQARELDKASVAMVTANRQLFGS